MLRNRGVTRWTARRRTSAAVTADRLPTAKTSTLGSQPISPTRQEIANIPIEIDETSQRCTLISDDMHIQGAAADVTVVTDENLRMSVAELGGQRVPITEAEADALTVAGAVDGRRHLKTTEPGSVI